MEQNTISRAALVIELRIICKVIKEIVDASSKVIIVDIGARDGWLSREIKKYGIMNKVVSVDIEPSGTNDGKLPGNVLKGTIDDIIEQGYLPKGPVILAMIWPATFDHSDSDPYDWNAYQSLVKEKYDVVGIVTIVGRRDNISLSGSPEWYRLLKENSRELTAWVKQESNGVVFQLHAFADPKIGVQRYKDKIRDKKRLKKLCITERCNYILKGTNSLYREICHPCNKERLSQFSFKLQ